MVLLDPFHRTSSLAHCQTVGEPANADEDMSLDNTGSPGEISVGVLSSGGSRAVPDSLSDTAWLVGLLAPTAVGVSSFVSHNVKRRQEAAPVKPVLP